MNIGASPRDFLHLNLPLPPFDSLRGPKFSCTSLYLPVYIRGLSCFFTFLYCVVAPRRVKKRKLCISIFTKVFLQKHFYKSIFTKALRTDGSTDGKTYGRPDGKTDGRTDRETSGRTERHALLQPLRPPQLSPYSICLGCLRLGLSHHVTLSAPSVCDLVSITMSLYQRFSCDFHASPGLNRLRPARLPDPDLTDFGKRGSQ